MAILRSIFISYLFWTFGTATTPTTPKATTLTKATNFTKATTFTKTTTSASTPAGGADNPLFLTSLINTGKLEEALNKSRVEPLIGSVESYAGYLTVNETSKSHLFFWFFPKSNPVNATTAPVILWLGGGPGTSSLRGLFDGTGPFEVIQVGDRSPFLRQRTPSWTDDNHMLYIDQPVDTGFSFTEGNGYVNSTKQAAEHLYVALVQFFKLFPQYATHDFYMAGESYAGKYIPALGYKIDRANRRPKVRQPIKLKGMIIGNGFTDPENMLAYDELLHGVGLIYKNERAGLQKLQNEIKNRIRSSDWSGAYSNFTNLLSEVLRSMNTSNYQDYRLVDEFPNATYPSFVSQDHIRRMLHVGSRPFVHKSKRVERNFEADFLQSARPWVEELLEKYRFLFYNGIFDILCSPLFTETYVDEFHWSGASGFSETNKTVMIIDEKLAGYDKWNENMRLMTIRDSGHNPSRHQPEVTRKIVKYFIEKQKFPEKKVEIEGSAKSVI